MPAEWAPHAATWTSWPFDDELWFGHLEGVRQEFATLVRTISRFEPVNVLVRDQEAEEDARRRLADVTERVTFHRIPLNDVWFRDNGPLFVVRGEELSLVNWEFNAWGQKYHWDKDNLATERVVEYLGIDHWDVPIVMEGGSLELNNQGTALTTRQCLLSVFRNPNLDEAKIARYLCDYLGIEQLLWLENGLEGDHTDGHIDTIVRFTDDNTIVCSVEADTSDANHLTMKANFEALQSFRNLQNEPFRVIPLPLPQLYLEEDGVRLPPTYANFYIGNGFVVVPQYGDLNDTVALDILRPLFPDREVIGLPSRNIIRGGGSFHCVTQQQPAGTVWKTAAVEI